MDASNKITWLHDPKDLPEALEAITSIGLARVQGIAQIATIVTVAGQVRHFKTHMAKDLEKEFLDAAKRLLELEGVGKPNETL